MSAEHAHTDPVSPNDSWLGLLIVGDSQTEQEFWDQYGDRLTAVARRRLSDRMRQRLDAEDVVQSACRTFFRRVRKGEFRLEDKSDLWKLMVTITLNKTRQKARHHGRDCRSMDREHAMLVEPPTAGSKPSHIADLEFDDFLKSLMERLSQEQQEVFLRTLDDQNQEEIASAMGCSKRTVRRLQSRIRERLEFLVEPDQNADI